MIRHISILLTIVDITPFLLLHNVDIARIIDIESEVVTRLVRTIMRCVGGLFGDRGPVAADAQWDHSGKVLLCAWLLAALDLGHMEALLQDGAFEQVRPEVRVKSLLLFLLIVCPTAQWCECTWGVSH